MTREKKYKSKEKKIKKRKNKKQKRGGGTEGGQGLQTEVKAKRKIKGQACAARENNNRSLGHNTLQVWQQHARVCFHLHVLGPNARARVCLCNQHHRRRRQNYLKRG